MFADENRKTFVGKGQIGKSFHVVWRIFGNMEGHLKQRGMHHCLRGTDDSMLI